MSSGGVLEVVDDLCHDMISTIGWWTIPDRIHAWLDKPWPGTPLSFHEVFEDELPEVVDRKRLLSFLSFAPLKLKNAIVDTESGPIYKYHQESWIRIGRVGALVLWFLLLSVGVTVLGNWIVGGERPSLSGLVNPGMYIPWLGVVAGVAFPRGGRQHQARARSGLHR